MNFYNSLSNTFPLALNDVTRKWLLRLLRVGVTLAALRFIYLRLLSEQAFERATWLSLSPRTLGLLLLALLLVPINWGLEAAKWHRFLQPLYPELRLFTAFKGVLVGIATGMFTPNRVGEYAGRMWMVPATQRVAAVTYTFLNRIYQMIMTLGLGTLAFEYLAVHSPEAFATLFPHPALHTWMRYSLWGSNLLAWACILLPRYVDRWVLRRFPAHGWVQQARQALAAIDTVALLQVLGLSLLRYGVFTCQYVLLMVAFGYESGCLLAFAMIGLIFLVKSAIPFVSVAELGIRESIALAVMGAFAGAASMAFASTFLLYLLNIILPALLGLLLFLHKRPT